MKWYFQNIINKEHYLIRKEDKVLNMFDAKKIIDIKGYLILDETGLKQIKYL